ncbi:MAG: hypothetical protein Q8L29_04235 [archaeon]|nr:hypothetical protein [archaeon]
MKFEDYKEFKHVLAVILVLTIVISFSSILDNNWEFLAPALLFSAIIIVVHVFSKKIGAHLLDADVEHEIWSFSEYGLMPHQHFKKSLPYGLIIPLFFAIFTLGKIKVMTFLTYETRALKVRAAKRFGYYSYAEMTDWHNGLIGTAGIISILLLSAISYFSGFEFLARMSAFYAFFNMIPLGKIDGSQIFFGSKILWTTLAAVTLIFAAYALLLV